MHGYISMQCIVIYIVIYPVHKIDYNYICNTFTPKIKGIQRVTYLMSPWFEGNIVMSPLPYKSFVEGSIFIIKVGGFDCYYILHKNLIEESITLLASIFCVLINSPKLSLPDFLLTCMVGVIV